MSERLPPPDLQQIATVDPDTVTVAEGELVWRIHKRAGPHPTTGDALRHYGPTTARFDPHPEPAQFHPDIGITYLTIGDTAFVTVLAEAFQQEDGVGVGPIDRATDQPTLTGFAVERDLALLDLHSGWVTRAGGNTAICNGSRMASKQWARAIHTTYPELDGIAYPSAVYAPGRCLAVWTDRIFPDAPMFSRDLSDQRLGASLAVAAQELGTYNVPTRTNS